MNHPDRAGNAFNVAGNPAGDQTWVLNARVIEFRVDHNFTPNFRMSESFYWGHRPALRRCNQSGRCTAEVLNNAQTSPEKNTNYYGNGFYQRIATHHAHTQFDWIIRNNSMFRGSRFNSRINGGQSMATDRRSVSSEGSRAGFAEETRRGERPRQ